MLKKLLKYDLRIILRYWWIGAVASFSLSILESVLIYLVSKQEEPPAALIILLVLTSIPLIFSYTGFFIASAIFIFTRYYRNFFTDEGYLTFTIPVKRWQLLASKIIAGTIAMILTSIVFFTELAIIIVTIVKSAIPADVFSYNVTMYDIGLDLPKGLLAIYGIEFAIMSLISTVISIMFVYICITLASLVSKKARVIIAIAFYYGINTILSTVLQIFASVAYSGISIYLSESPVTTQYWFIGIGLLGCVFLSAIIALLMFTLLHYMLDRKLNLN